MNSQKEFIAELRADSILTKESQWGKYRSTKFYIEKI